VDVTPLVNRDEPGALQRRLEWKAKRRRRNNIHPQPEEVLASWVSPHTEILPRKPEPGGGYKPREGFGRSDYTAYELPMDW